MRQAFPRYIACGLLYLLALPAFAHDFWIEPDQFITTPGQTTKLTLREGMGFKGDSLPYITDWFHDFSITDQQGKRPIKSEMGDDPAAIFKSSTGTTLIGYHSTRNFVDLKPDKFNHYLQDEGMEYIIPLRKKLGEHEKIAREYFIRCAKTLINQGPDHQQTYRTALGYPLEIIPLNNPYALKPGDVLELQLRYLGSPIQGLRMRAFSKDQPGVMIDVRTDKNGRGRITIPHPGTWIIKSVHMTALDNDPKARWESYWASLLFEMR